MTSVAEKFTPFAERMQAEGLPDIVVKTFEYYYTQLVEGETGLIREADIKPVESLPDVETFSAELAEAGGAILSQAVLLGASK
jgi:hypothetical protein